MEHVQHKSEEPRWIWHAPIHDWSKEQCRDYLERFGLPENDLWNTLGRSGDCFCGCFGSPEEKLDLRVAGCPDHTQWLESLERSVDIDDIQKERETWAWGALSKKEQVVERAQNDEEQMTLCSKCTYNGQQ
jgi:3'-phosphoadenosine 5'-phosphosulfate sulfotransferase (PAPS reductase)/FAD synthetase